MPRPCDYPDLEPRQTFAFDRVLYRDDAIRVTPSCLVLAGREIDIDRVDAVFKRTPRKPPLMKPRWWQRIAPSERIRARAPPTPPEANLIIAVTDNYNELVQLRLLVERPDEVKLAINDARSIIY